MEKLKREQLQYACTSREEKAIRLYWKGRTLAEIGRELGVSSHRAGSIIGSALHRMEEVTAEELHRAKGQRPIMRIPEFDTTKTRLIRFVLWDSKLRTLEQVAEAGYEKLKNIGLSEKSILTIVKILQVYNLSLKNWKEKETKDTRIAEITEEFQNWWNTTKAKVPSADLPEIRRAIRRILYS